MTCFEVWVLLLQDGVREVAQPVVTQYRTGELSLDAAAHRLAMIARARLRGDAKPFRSTILPLVPEVAMYQYLSILAAALKGNTPSRPLLLRISALSGTPALRLRSPDEVSRLGLGAHALRDFVRAWTRPVALYSRVARLLEQRREDERPS